MKKPSGKQTTFDGFPKTEEHQPPAKPKQISIKEMTSETGVDELTLTVAFKLAPSRVVFSKVKADLTFNGEPVHSVVLRVPQGALATDEFEYSSVLDMKGIPAGTYQLQTTLYEEDQYGKKRCAAIKQIAVDYVPQTRESRLVKIPSVKSVAGADIAVTTKTQVTILTEREDTLRKEQMSRRDRY